MQKKEDRPKSKFFIDNLFNEFISLSGDRFYGEDKSVICGFGKFNSKSVLVIGQEKGENLDTSCLLYTSPSPRDLSTSRMPSSA